MSDVRDQPFDEGDQAMVDAAAEIVRRRGDGVLHTVGAALLADDGSLYSAVNVFAQGGGACAELAALAKAVSEGSSRSVRIVAVGDDERGVLEPCGVCRQLLLDYAPTIEVIIRDAGALRRASLSELLPLSQRSWCARNDE